jgi:hypothetical protein
LLRHDFRRAAAQVGRVHERIKPAIDERFHGDNLTTNSDKSRAGYTKDTKSDQEWTI